MAGYKNFAGGAVLGESDLDDYLMEQTVMVFASAAARDTALASAKQDGTLTYQQDTNKYTAYDGAAWWTVGQASGFAGMISGAGASYVDQSGSVAFTSHHTEYTIVNGMCDFWFSHTVSAAGSAGTAVYTNLAVNAANDLRQVGSGMIYDASAGLAYTGVWEIVSGFVGRISLLPGTASAGYWGATPSIALASGDIIKGHVRYQVAAAA